MKFYLFQNILAKNEKISAAAIQGHFLIYKDSAEKALENIDLLHQITNNENTSL